MHYWTRQGTDLFPGMQLKNPGISKEVNTAND
jgi:hypothetical protein